MIQSMSIGHCIDNRFNRRFFGEVKWKCIRCMFRPLRYAIKDYIRFYCQKGQSRYDQTPLEKKRFIKKVIPIAKNKIEK